MDVTIIVETNYTGTIEVHEKSYGGTLGESEAKALGPLLAKALGRVTRACEIDAVSEATR